MQKLVKTQKSTNNPLSIFGLIEENMELSHIHLVVQWEILSRIKTEWTISNKYVPKIQVVQFNKYETAPNFIQLSQNLTSDCLLISVFLPVFAWCDHKIVLFWSAEQFYDQVMQELRKNREIQLNQQTIRCQVLA